MIDWADEDIGDWLTPLADHLKHAGRLRRPDRRARWSPDAGTATTIKAAIADERIGRLSQAMPDVVEPRRQPAAQPAPRARAGGRRRTRTGFAAGQPRFVFQLPIAGQDPATSCCAGMNQLWRRNIKKADKVGRRRSSRAARPTCPTSTRSTSRPPSGTASRPGRSSYFETDVHARCRTRTRIGSGSTSPGTTGDLVAATTWVRVGRARLVHLRRSAPPPSATSAARTRPSGG